MDQFSVFFVFIVFAMFNFQVSTINVNGLRDQTKRDRISQSCGSDIIMLQETHASGFREARAWARDFDCAGFWSFGSKSSSGVAILLSKRHVWKPDGYLRDNSGRLVSITITVPDTKVKVRLVNCYAPNSPAEKQTFFSRELPKHTQHMRNIILGGDFNCICNPDLDSKNSSNQQGTRGFFELSRVTKQRGLVDGWRLQHPNRKRFTWHSGDGNRATRIDRIYLSRELASSAQSEIVSFPLSDHDMVSTKIQIFSGNYGRGAWKLNTSYLNDELFQRTMRVEFDSHKKNKGNFNTLSEWWDRMKTNIKRAAVSFCVQASRNRNLELKRILKELNQLQNQIDNGKQNVAQALKLTEARYAEILKKQIPKSSNSSVQKITGEKVINRPYTHDPDLKRMSNLKCPDGRITADPAEMTTTCRQFYQDLYTTTPVNQSEIELLLDNIDKTLDSEQRELIEGPVLLSEVKSALHGMDTGKSPGSDGLPAEFYRTFFKYIGQDVCDVLNSAFAEGELSSTQKTGLITLIHKKGDRNELNNWRPISLLNVDYKILSKILSTRVRQILHSVINIDQTCSVAGRSILDNAHLLRNIQDYAEQKNIGLALVSLDQQKAFDRVNRGYLRQVLDKFGFGNNFLQWFDTLHNGINSSVICNGNISEPFSITRGVRQGCPLSPLLYVLALEPLGCAIRADSTIHGVKLPGGSEAKISMYADDATLILSDDRSIKNSFKVIERFERASGAKLNQQKSQGLYLGRWRGRRDGPVNIPWVDSAKIIGHTFGKDRHNLWENKISEIESAVKNWEGKELTMKGRVAVVNTFILSKIWFLAEVDPPRGREVKRINRLIFPFIWGHKGEFVGRATMCLPSSKGGLGVINIEDKIAAMQSTHIKQILDGTKPKWKALAKYWCAMSLRAQNPNLVRVNMPLCDTMPEFYTSVIATYRIYINHIHDWSKITHKLFLATAVERQGTLPKVQRDSPGKDWATIWKRNLNRKLHNRHVSLNFRMIHNILPTGNRLCKKTKDPGRCPHCTRVETVEHLFTECIVVKAAATWLSLYLGTFNEAQNLPDRDTLIYSLFQISKTKQQNTKMLKALSLFRMVVWQARNEAKFDAKPATPAAILSRLGALLGVRVGVGK